MTLKLLSYNRATEYFEQISDNTTLEQKECLEMSDLQ